MIARIASLNDRLDRGWLGFVVQLCDLGVKALGIWKLFELTR